MNTIWINAGELSGDMHGALLLKALKAKAPEYSYVGMGGLHLQEAGLDLRFSIDQLSVMGFTEVLTQLPRIMRLLKDIKLTLMALRPKAIIVIDAPDFHFRVIKIARSLGIPVYYYISPKIWAWRQDRAEFLRKNVRKIISILPFEVDFYRRFNMEVAYVGNPLVDIVNYPALEHIKPISGHIGFLPGSRHSEVTSLLPEFGKAAAILLQRLPHLTFTCIRAPNMSADYLQSLWPKNVPVTFAEPEGRWEGMRSCEMLIAASGTVTLESAIVGTPTIATYKVSPITYQIGKALIRIKYMSLANLIMDMEIFPELIQDQADAEPLANKALEWLLPPYGAQALRAVRYDLDEVRKSLGIPGAPNRAAEVILKDSIFA